MSAAPFIPPRDLSTVNMVEIQGGTVIRLEDIATASQARTIMDELDADILDVEDQIASLEMVARNGWDWRRRAERALRIKKRVRNSLQERIGVLNRAERAAAIAAEKAARLGVKAVQVDAKRQAFVHAAYGMLGHEACTEIWARAAEINPAAFVGDNAGEPA